MFTAANVCLRPEIPEDADFLEDLFVANKDDAPGWRELLPAERTRLLKEQSALQRLHYRKFYPQAWFTIIEVEGKPAGRLCVNQSPKEMRVVDISILPEYRQHGIGSRLIQQVITESTRLKRPLRLCAELGSTVHSFYQKLGFIEFKRDGTHVHYQWVPVAR